MAIRSRSTHDEGSHLAKTFRPRVRVRLIDASVWWATLVLLMTAGLAHRMGGRGHPPPGSPERMGATFRASVRWKTQPASSPQTSVIVPATRTP